MSGHPKVVGRGDAGLQADAEDLQNALSDLVRIYQFRDRNRICCYDISVTQCYALEALVDHGPLRLSALADRMYLDKSTASRVVQTLVRKGYAANGGEAGDRRAMAIAPTRSGRLLLQRIKADLVEQQKLVVQDIEPDVRAGVIEVVRRLTKAAEARSACGGIGSIESQAAGDCCGKTKSEC
jgi:MarR family transcriptional regulator, 2-MHQ and catechol-resistance regulon repressor